MMMNRTYNKLIQHVIFVSLRSRIGGYMFRLFLLSPLQCKALPYALSAFESVRALYAQYNM